LIHPTTSEASEAVHTFTALGTLVDLYAVPPAMISSILSRIAALLTGRRGPSAGVAVHTVARLKGRVRILPSKFPCGVHVAHNWASDTSSHKRNGR
jgi:hypothetical protein